MVETVMDEHEIKQMNDYAMTKWVNEMQVRNSADPVRHRVGRRPHLQHLRPGRVLQPVPFGELPLHVLRAARHPVARLPRVWPHVDLHRRFGADPREHQRELPARRGLQHRRRRFHTIEELSDLIIEATGADPSLVEYRDSEILTTHNKVVDNSKAVQGTRARDDRNARRGHHQDGGLDAGSLRLLMATRTRTGHWRSRLHRLLSRP